MPLLICATSSRSGHVQALAEAACQAYAEGGGQAEPMPAATGDLDRLAAMPVV